MSTDNNEKPKKRKRSFIEILVPTVLVIMMLVFFGLFLKDFLEYKAASDEYADLNQNITVVVPETSAPQEVAAEPEDTTPPELKPGYFPTLDIDYATFEKKNADFAGIIYVPALDILYPVAKSHDNADYLHHTFEGKYNFAGCIFMDALANGNYDEPNTFIFGHNMKNGTMFGMLKHFSTQPGTADSNPFIYIYNKDRILKYRIIAYYMTDSDSDAYEDFTGPSGYEEYVDKLLKRSEYAFDPDTVDLASQPPLITLSTCSGKDGNHRFIVHGALVEVK